MYDGSALSMRENLGKSVELMRRCAENDILLEVECGVVGGEEDGLRGDGGEKLYTTPEDMIAVYEALSAVPDARFMVAATFGNVHGVYKPGQVKLRPAVLKEGQDALAAKHGPGARLWLVFHGGSGSSEAEIHEAIAYGVVKMNIHTTHSMPLPAPSQATCLPATAACCALTAKSASRTTTSPARGSRRAEPAWPRASSKPATP